MSLNHYLLLVEISFDDLFNVKVGGRLRCIGSPQNLKTRFGNHLELEVWHRPKHFREKSFGEIFFIIY